MRNESSQKCYDFSKKCDEWIEAFLSPPQFCWLRSRSFIGPRGIQEVFGVQTKVLDNLIVYISEWFITDLHCYAWWLALKDRATLSFDQKLNWTITKRAFFPALRYLYMLGVLIDSLDCLFPLWLANLITLVLILNASPRKEKFDSLRSMWHLSRNHLVGYL